MKFYVGMHMLSTSWRLPRACISIKRLMRRRRPETWNRPKKWMMDSGAFTELLQHGAYRHTPAQFISELRRHLIIPYRRPDVVVSQDFMCEPVMLKKTGLTVLEHQKLTIERYKEIKKRWEWDVPLMPVLQGWTVEDYVRHVDMYGDLLGPDMWTGVGSVCKRQGDIELIVDILDGILGVRPDLLLHGFGVKAGALKSPWIRRELFSADSMAWSFAARYDKSLPGNAANDWRQAAKFYEEITGIRVPTDG